MYARLYSRTWVLAERGRGQVRCAFSHTRFAACAFRPRPAGDADFASYIAAQATINQWYRDPDAWIRKSILTVSRRGDFPATVASASTPRTYGESTASSPDQ